MCLWEMGFLSPLELTTNKGTKGWFWRMNDALVHRHGHSRTAQRVTGIQPPPLTCFSKAPVSRTVNAVYFMRITSFLICFKRWKILVPSLQALATKSLSVPPPSRKQTLSSQTLGCKILISCKLDGGKNQMQSVFCLLYMEIIPPKCFSS